MIKPGIKVGPKDWRSKLEESQAKYCEVWYNADQPKDYPVIFSYLNNHGIKAGLHYWAVIDEYYEPNIAYPGEIQKKTIESIQSCLKTAGKNGFHYVNIHSGNYHLMHLDLDGGMLIPDPKSPQIPLEEALATQKSSLRQLISYAKSQKVDLYIEPIPAKTYNGSYHDSQARLQPLEAFSLPVNTLINTAKTLNLNITNDLAHVFTDDFDKPPPKLWQSFWQKTKQLAPYTKLIHVNTVEPPFNGTDTHHGILESDYEIDGLFPQPHQLNQILKIFKDRDDVWAINEPQTDHVANYFALKRFIGQITGPKSKN